MKNPQHKKVSDLLDIFQTNLTSTLWIYGSQFFFPSVKLGPGAFYVRCTVKEIKKPY